MSMNMNGSNTIMEEELIKPLKAIKANIVERVAKLQAVESKVDQLLADLTSYISGVEETKPVPEVPKLLSIVNATKAAESNPKPAATKTVESVPQPVATKAVESNPKPVATKVAEIAPQSRHEQIKAEHAAKNAAKRERRERHEQRQAAETEKSQKEAATRMGLQDLLDSKGTRAEFLLDTSAIMQCPTEILQQNQKRFWATKYSLNSVRGIANDMDPDEAGEARAKVELFQNVGNVMEMKIEGNDLMGNMSVMTSHRIQGGAAQLFLPSGNRYFLVGSASLYEVCLQNGLSESQVLRMP